MPDDPTPVTAPADAGRVVDALRSASEQEFQIAERVAAKARQAYALAAGVFVVGQTVAFNGFRSEHLTGARPTVIVVSAILAALALAWATYTVLRADDTIDSSDLDPEALVDYLNRAYDGDTAVIGELGGAYSGVVKTRREANSIRRGRYNDTRKAVGVSLFAVGVELGLALILRVL